MIQPFILGSGRAAQAIAKSFHMIGMQEPELALTTPRQLGRGDSLAGLCDPSVTNLLAIANPTGLHAKTILEAAQVGFDAILCEKPVCVTLDEIKSLREVTAKVAVFHGYRQMWGPQNLRRLLQTGEFGEIISIESRYWQASVASRAAEGKLNSADWKNDPKLNGHHDVLLDLGTHWADLMTYLMGEKPSGAQGWISYVNAETPHRDTHVNLTLKYPGGARALGSISKAVHGATNGFELNILGAKQSAYWNFLSPDEVTLGKGRDRFIITRKESLLGGQQPPFHGLGWVDGYAEIVRQTLLDLTGKDFMPYPTLQESLDATEVLLTAELDGRRKF